MSAEPKTTKFNISDALLRSLNETSTDKAAMAPAKAQNRKSIFMNTLVDSSRIKTQDGGDASGAPG